MSGRIKFEQIAAELAEVENLLAASSPSDFAGRIGLEERADELRNELSTISTESRNLASVALYFGGKPVIGSRSIDAEFAANMLNSYQNIVTRVWQEGVSELTDQRRILDQSASHFHVTNILHGSFGFALEEIDENGIPLFPSALREASDRVAEFISAIADDDEEVFSDLMTILNNRIFSELRNFFRNLYKANATFRLVGESIDKTFDYISVSRAYERAEQTNIDEEEFLVFGELLGIIPFGRRFEFKRSDDETIISGKVGLLFSQEYLERISKEQLAGKPCLAVFQRREIKKLGKTRETFVLIRLEKI